jgi:hypothetical protein
VEDKIRQAEVMRCRDVPSQHQGRDELVPAASHVMEQHMNNPIEADHGRLKSRL